MKTTLKNIAFLFALIPLVALTASAAEAPSTNPYEIKNIAKTVKKVAYVDNGWKDNAPVIEVQLRVNRDIGTDKPFAKAYFYNRENKLLKNYDKPVQASDDHKNYTSMPELFKPKDAYKVSFPISERATQPGEKWSRVIIVFGDKNYLIAECYPKDELSKFEFPEKERALAGGAAAGVGTTR